MKKVAARSRRVSAEMRNARWVRQGSPTPFAVYMMLGLAITVVVERSALATGRWRYAPDMPTFGGIGLPPLLLQ